jgi:hypothetical protein
MKNLLVSLIAIILTSCAGNAQITEKEIGVNEKGVYKITIDQDFLKKVLEEQLRKDKNDAVLTEFKIKKDVMENDTSKEYFILVAQNKDGSTKIAFDLELTDNVFFARFRELSLVSSCTCSGSCTSGCDPKHRMDDDGYVVWRCSACTQPGKTCNKSVTDNN